MYSGKLFPTFFSSDLISLDEITGVVIDIGNQSVRAGRPIFFSIKL